jgi:hypothetical protein
VLIIPAVFVVSATIGIIAGDFIRWGGLFVFTTFIFGFFINDSRRFLRKKRFWLLTAVLLGAHYFVFLFILLRVSDWKLLWFCVVILELPPFTLVRNRLIQDITS